MTAKSRNVYYITHIAHDPAQRADESPAARNKVMGVCAAIAAGGETPVIVGTLGRTVTGLLTPFRKIAETNPTHIEVFAPGRGSRRRIVAAFTLLWFGLRTVRHDDRVILYNAYPEHLFLAILQWLRGNRCVVDVEDVPFPTGTFANFVERLIYPLLLRVTSNNRIVASRMIARQAGFDSHLALYGVTNAFEGREAPANRFDHERVAVLLGGTVVEDTGAELFLATLAQLAQIKQPVPLDIHITGKFDEKRFAEAAAQANLSGKVRVELHRDLSQQDYRALLDLSAVGLSLRIPNSGVAQWTFPSKVIEITASGLLLVSTAVSDVPDIFDENTAILLKEATPRALADALIWIATNRDRAAAIAAAGQRHAKECFSAQKVGAALVPFLDAR